MPHNPPGGEIPPEFQSIDWELRDRGNPSQRAEIVGNICLNSYKDIKHFEVEDLSHIPVVLCGGGPSLKENLPLIKQLQEQGARVVCINDSHVYLQENGVEPFCWVYGEVQYLPDDHRWFRGGKKPPLYVPSHCDHHVLDRLMDKNTVMWHWGGNELTDLCIGTFYPGEPAFKGSGIPLLRFLYVMVGGWNTKQIHLFGADSSHRGSEHHAYDAYTPTQPVIRSWCYGKEFITNPHLLHQARDFCNIVNVWNTRNMGINVWVYGDGLLPHLAQHHLTGSTSEVNHGNS